MKNQCNDLEELEVLVGKEVIELHNGDQPEISLLLIKCARELGFQSSALNDKQACDLSLKRAIDLRHKGEHEESLNVLSSVIESGYKSDLIDDNYARALVQLGRIPEALSIWEKLVDSDVQRVKESSRQFIEKFLQKLQDELIDVCTKNSCDVVHLKTICSDFKEFEMFVLKEVIELRSAGNPEISLLLIQKAQQLGFQSSMLIDNKARALVSLNQLREAIIVWDELVDSPDENVSNSAKKMISKFNVIAAKSIIDNVNTAASELNIELVNMNKLENISLSELEICLLKDVVAIRDGGNDEASLRIIDSAILAGAQREECLLDNRARALHNLNRFPEAISIWNELQGSNNQDIRKKSKRFADSATEKYLQSIQKAVVVLYNDYGVNIQSLFDKCITLDDFEKLMLQEAVSARQSGRVEFSFQLIQQISELGFTSPRLRDNQARALINLKRVPEAVLIWRELLNTEQNSEFQQQIQKMLDKYGVLSDRLCIIEKCSELAANGDNDTAKIIAVNAIIDDPDWDEPRNLLVDILKIEARDVVGRPSLNSDLENHRLDLELCELIISNIEKRMEESVAN